MTRAFDDEFIAIREIKQYRDRVVKEYSERSKTHGRSSIVSAMYTEAIINDMLHEFRKLDATCSREDFESADSGGHCARSCSCGPDDSDT